MNDGIIVSITILDNCAGDNKIRCTILRPFNERDPVPLIVYHRDQSSDGNLYAIEDIERAIAALQTVLKLL